MKRIGIITWHYYDNFGSALQSYSLQQIVIALSGGECEFINYRKPIFGKPNIIIDAIRLVLGTLFGRYIERFNYGHFMFMHKYLKQGRMTLDETKLPKLTSKYNIIICGSDQIWAPNVYHPVYFASFAKPGVAKISYAASIGLNDIPEDLAKTYKDHLSDFYAISVREEEGQELLKRKCGIEASLVLDPTLLNDSEFYKRIERKVLHVNEKFLFCYFLNREHNYKERVIEYAKLHNLIIVGVSLREDDNTWMNCLHRLGADQFIWLINHSEAILTDSYHGAIFSLLFHKNFWLFQRFNEGDPLCQNSRIRQLKNYFGSCVRIISGNDPIDENISIDYNAFEADLIPLRKRSIDYLRKSLQ